MGTFFDLKKASTKTPKKRITPLHAITGISVIKIWYFTLQKRAIGTRFSSRVPTQGIGMSFIHEKIKKRCINKAAISPTQLKRPENDL